VISFFALLRIGDNHTLTFGIRHNRAIRLVSDLAGQEDKAWPHVTKNSIPISSSGLQTQETGERRAAGAQSELAASLAHEINNPLDVLLNLLYLMESQATLTQEGRQYLRLAREEVHRISEIAQSALHEFRHSALPKDTNVPKLLRSVLDLYRSRLESRGISVRTRFSSEGNLAVYAGPLRQVISNLLLNAADAMPQGGRLHARVSAAHEWTGSERHGLRLTVADNGCGIPADKLSKVLEPFFTTKGAGGNGLGLSLVQDVVQKHRGVLRVRSSTKPGHTGSIFSIFLPATR
jgi:signal transduction histidine kinase